MVIIQQFSLFYMLILGFEVEEEEDEHFNSFFSLMNLTRIIEIEKH